jgi:hypothetical protein
MNDEIPYNPGIEAYIREGARHNQRLLDKWKKENPGKQTEDWVKSLGITPPLKASAEPSNAEVSDGAGGKL